MFKLYASLIVTVFCVSVAIAQEASLFQELLVTDPVGVRYGDAVSWVILIWMATKISL